MKDQTGLVRRKGSSNWYYRGRVPADLLDHYGKAEIWRSLRTPDFKEARQRSALERVKLDQEFRQARALLAAPPVAELEPVEIERLAALWHAHLLEEDEDFRKDGPSERAFERHGETLAVVTDVASHQLARGQVDDDWLAFEMGDFLESYVVKIQPGTGAWRELSFAFLKAYRKALDGKQSRQRGEVVDTPQVEPPVLRSHPQSREGDTLDALLDYWKTQGEKRPRTIQEASTVFKVFQDLNPGLAAPTVGKSHVVAFKDKLLEAGDSPATVKKKLGLLKAVFQTAADNGKIAGNPADGVKVPRPKVEKKSRIPFSVDDLKAIFASEVFTAGKRPIGGRGEAAFWVPLIGLWSGARLEEIGQLLTDDIKEERGTHYFSITNDAGSVKTTSSRRRVPLHPELVKCGFLAYVAQLRERKEPRLFPLLEAGEGRQLTAPLSQWWGRYLRGVVKIKDPRKVFHSFRHGFKDACRDCGISKDIHDRLTGHGKGDVGDGYGGEDYPLAPLADAINKLCYDGLDLSHLRKPATSLA